LAADSSLSVEIEKAFQTLLLHHLETRLACLAKRFQSCGIVGCGPGIGPDFVDCTLALSQSVLNLMSSLANHRFGNLKTPAEQIAVEATTCSPLEDHTDFP
jgi:hypothetical protein